MIKRTKKIRKLLSLDRFGLLPCLPVSGSFAPQQQIKRKKISVNKSTSVEINTRA